MRKSLVAALSAILLSTTALAADKGAPAAPAPVVEDTAPLIKTSCYLEGSAGKSATASRVSDQINGAITLTADGMQLGVGVGCDLDIGRFFIGALARYDFTDVSGTYSDVKVGQDNMWMAAARGGFRLNYNTRLYGLAGVAGTDLTYGDFKVQPDGVVYGIGVETNIGLYGLPETINVGLEWDHVAWDKSQEFAAVLRPDTDIIRATLKLKVDLFK